MTASEALRAALPAWMARQRWYTGKGREPRLEPVGGLALPGPDGVDVATWLVRDVGAAEPVLYQVPLTVRPAAVPGLEHALVAEAPGQVVYDGCHDPAGAAALLAAVVDEARLGPAGGDDDLGARGHRAGAAVFATGSRVLRGEQSNTSIIFDVADGAPVILKVFRVVQAGHNPDVEVQEALASGGSTRVPRPLGDLLGWWPDGDRRAEGHLAFAQEFLPGVEDAWRVALRALETGTDFADRARALGEATAEVHAVLARALPTAEADEAAREAMLDGWRQRFAAAVEAVPELAARAEDVEAVLRAGAAAPWPPLQRIHGDYHLGQVLDVPGRGWVLLDFEGEPLRPLAERTAPDLPQRDIAGMLRSFDYAAGSATVAARESGGSTKTPAGPAAAGREAGQAAELSAHEAWASRAREAFLDGYGAATGRDPRADAALLRALELDKALYEAVYEARNRPDWLPIPLAGVTRLLVG
ncbi:maltokinase N-terminal cap-like domain-containing protein [Georgenia thermotolerans]|uniref:Maltokinase n=1 Tax=Georgenia thermotolerans TaxID=527326 RepID=A0A7J5UIL8_9MICO|nr:phosphotransferase [Georgenia thermotolerans]KAE8762225.1 phosphotransferase [Georgenia thermotolerans]